MPGIHPLGASADPTHDLHSRENRRAVASCLSLYYADALTDKVNGRSSRSAVVGLPISDRMVTRLEIGSAIKRLGHERADLLLVVDIVYRQGYSREDAAEMFGMCDSTINRRITDALNLMVDWIFAAVA
jgi:DNA-directed RNA polymerase specialized sigma24 family protein